MAPSSSRERATFGSGYWVTITVTLFERPANRVALEHRREGPSMLAL
ncbi:MAG: hypothetical protein U1E60_03800 [Reyranellaceae bacterium]